MKLINFLKISASLIIILLLVFAAQSFKKTIKKDANTSYFYVGNDMSQGAFSDTSNWSTSGGGSCPTGTEAPCEIIVPVGKTLSEHIGGLSNEQVLDLAVSIRDVN